MSDHLKILDQYEDLYRLVNNFIDVSYKNQFEFSKGMLFRTIDSMDNSLNEKLRFYNKLLAETQTKIDEIKRKRS